MNKSNFTLILMLITTQFLMSCELSYNRSDQQEESAPQEEIIREVSKESSIDKSPLTNQKTIEDAKNDNNCENELSKRLIPELKARLSVLNEEHTKKRSDTHKIDKYLVEENITEIKNFTVDEIKVEPRQSSEGVIHLEHEFVDDPREGLSQQNDGELSEYYTITYNGYINIPNESYEGEYQIAALSDDGVIITLDEKQVLTDGIAHAPRFTCELNSIIFRTNKPVKFEMKYYQAPRHKVANVLMWRKMDNEQDYEECGKKRFNHSDDVGNGWEPIPSDVLFHDSGVCQ